uniref:CYCLIN domain-containing protein n=1 Tax=Haemonchus contortus TaxID=6289 RepID=A0A7I4XRI1_HAECO|nr:Cyclin domain containing protein [Haemonchus contortus]
MKARSRACASRTKPECGGRRGVPSYKSESDRSSSQRSSCTAESSHLPSTSSTGSRKRPLESFEISSTSSHSVKRRHTTEDSKEMAPEYLPSTSDDAPQTEEDDDLSVFTTDEESDVPPPSISYTDSEDEGDSSADNEELENDAFREMEAGLNDVMYHQKDAPPQLTALRCSGIGSPKKVWGLLCRKNELIRPSNRLLEKHPELTPHTRAILIDWMMEVCSSEKQHRETFHLAVDYVDRFLASFQGIRSQTYQLVGTSALFLASKYEEIYPPKLEELVTYTDGACSEQDVRRFEIIMLKELQWSLAPLTSIHWLSMYMQFLGNKEVPKNSDDKHVVDQPFIVPDTLREDFVNMAKVLDLLLLDVGSFKYSYRELAAAVLFACYEPHALVQEVTGYSYSALLKVVEWVEPVVKACDRLRALGDPMPVVEGIRADDLHNIQTHPDQEFDEVMTDIEKERELAKMAREKVKVVPMSRRRGPLRSRCTNPDQITIFS